MRNTLEIISQHHPSTRLCINKTISLLQIPKPHQKETTATILKTKRNENASIQAMYMAYLDDFKATLLCNALCARLSAASFVRIPIDFAIAFIIPNNRGGEIPLTGGFAIGVSGTRSFNGNEGDGRSGSAAGRQERRHCSIRQLFEGEEPT